MVTVKEWLKNSSLEEADKRVLFRRVTGLDRIKQLTCSDKLLSEAQLAELAELSSLRLSGVPVPYLTGEQEFFGRSFSVNSDVLIPRPDTECLIEWLIEHLPKHAIVCDLGTGSGCIAVTLALERSDLSVYASDISPKALATAQNNAKRLGASVTFFTGSWFDPYPCGIRWNAVVSNPPYIRPNDAHLKALSFEPQIALTDFHDGLNAYRRILSGIRERHICPDVIAFEHGYDQAADIVRLFDENGFPNAKTYRDYGSNPRFSVWEKVS